MLLADRAGNSGVTGNFFGALIFLTSSRRPAGWARISWDRGQFRGGPSRRWVRCCPKTGRISGPHRVAESPGLARHIPFFCPDLARGAFWVVCGGSGGTLWAVSHLVGHVPVCRCGRSVWPAGGLFPLVVRWWCVLGTSLVSLPRTCPALAQTWGGTCSAGPRKGAVVCPV
jgi:hypothetical protein